MCELWVPALPLMPRRDAAHQAFYTHIPIANNKIEMRTRVSFLNQRRTGTQIGARTRASPNRLSVDLSERRSSLWRSGTADRRSTASKTAAPPDASNGILQAGGAFFSATGLCHLSKVRRTQSAGRTSDDRLSACDCAPQ
jgi:hypothetical protein